MDRLAKQTVVLLVGLFALPLAIGADGRGAGQHTPMTRATTSPSSDGIRLSKLIGSKVDDRHGKRAGEIRDVIVDTDSGKIHYAVLSVGGALRNRLFAVPSSKLRHESRDHLVVDVDRAELASAPGFDRAKWPNWRDDRYRAEVDQRYDTPRAAANARYRRATDVLKAKVRDIQGGTIGTVKDAIVDPAASRVEYLVVKFDRAWNPRDKLLLLPVSAFAGAAASAQASASAEGAAPPRNPPPTLALINPSGEPSKGTASAVNSPGGVQTRPPAIDAAPGAPVRPIETPRLKTTTSYADDENLVFKGTREQLLDAPEYDVKRYR